MADAKDNTGIKDHLEKNKKSKSKSIPYKILRAKQRLSGLVTHGISLYSNRPSREEVENPIYAESSPTGMEATGFRCECALLPCQCTIDITYQWEDTSEASNQNEDLNKKSTVQEAIRTHQRLLEKDIVYIEQKINSREMVGRKYEETLQHLKESHKLLGEARRSVEIAEWKTNAMVRLNKLICLTEDTEIIRKTIQTKIKSILNHEDYQHIPNIRKRMYTYVFDINIRTLDDCVTTKTPARESHRKHPLFLSFVVEMEQDLLQKEDPSCFKRTKEVSKLISKFLTLYANFLTDRLKDEDKKGPAGS